MADADADEDKLLSGSCCVGLSTQLADKQKQIRCAGQFAIEFNESKTLKQKKKKQKNKSALAPHSLTQKLLKNEPVDTPD